jgi:hypothetical protein
MSHHLLEHSGVKPQQIGLADTGNLIVSTAANGEEENLCAAIAVVGGLLTTQIFRKTASDFVARWSTQTREILSVLPGSIFLQEISQFLGLGAEWGLTLVLAGYVGCRATATETVGSSAILDAIAVADAGRLTKNAGLKQMEATSMLDFLSEVTQTCEGTPHLFPDSGLVTSISAGCADPGCQTTETRHLRRLEVGRNQPADQWGRSLAQAPEPCPTCPNGCGKPRRVTRDVLSVKGDLLLV